MSVIKLNIKLIGSIVLSQNITLTVCFCIFSLFVTAQEKKNKMEEINITSSFKPSIVKTSKLEFFPEVPPKDTNAFRFSYPITKLTFKTPLSAFSFKPLAYQAQPLQELKDNFYIKLGGGNLSTPFASLGYNKVVDNNIISLGLDHISSKGNLPNQQYANTKFEGQFKSILADNQSVKFQLGYQGDAYRNYGYDTSKFFFQENDLKQRFNQFNFGAAYDLVSGENGSLFFKPNFQVGYLTSKRGAKEVDLALKIPVTYVLEESIQLNAAIDFNYASLNRKDAVSTSAFLVQMPLKIDYTTKGLFASGGIIPVFKKNKALVVPEASLVYSFNEGTNVRLLAGITNIFNINGLQKLYEINPFLLAPDSLQIYQQTNYYVGFDWLSAKGLQLQAKAGIVRFKNLPLFVNDGASGKDFLVLNETAASAFFIESNLGYIFSDKFSFGSSLKAFSFQSQSRYEKAYGILPIELFLELNWKPIKPLSVKLQADIFGGNMAKAVGKPDIRTKGIFDLGLGVDYKLNKKWALWMDLNNIANAKYQRWNGYTSFGFNFLAGFKYNFTKVN